MVTIAIVSQKANVLVKCDSENLFASKGLNKVWSLFKKSLKQIKRIVLQNFGLQIPTLFYK